MKRRKITSWVRDWFFDFQKKEGIWLKQNPVLPGWELKLPITLYAMLCLISTLSSVALTICPRVLMMSLSLYYIVHHFHIYIYNKRWSLFKITLVYQSEMFQVYKWHQIGSKNWNKFYEKWKEKMVFSQISQSKMTFIAAANGV